MLPTSMLLASIDRMDHEYWLAHCEGFRVRAGGRRLGVVVHVRNDADRQLPERFGLHVCTGIVRRREIVIPLGDVERLDPHTRSVHVRRPDRRPTVPAMHAPQWLRRAGARARWAAQRG